MGQEINKLKCTRKLSFQVSVENNLKVKINLGASDSHATGILKNKINKKKLVWFWPCLGGVSQGHWLLEVTPCLSGLLTNLSALSPAHFCWRELNLFHWQLNHHLFPTYKLAMCWNISNAIYVICPPGACLMATVTNIMQQHLIITISWEQNAKNFNSFKFRISTELSLFLLSFLFLQSMRENSPASFDVCHQLQNQS